MIPIHQKIENNINQDVPGSIYFVEDFLNYGNYENIKKILLRLTNKKIIDRIAHGIYFKPEIHPEFGKLYPSIDTIAHKIAKRDKAKIAPTGVFALYLLGISTQVPLHAVYLTDGSQRIVNIGNQTIKFKHTVPKSFAIENSLLHLIVQAFKEVGNNTITDVFLNKIKDSILKVPSEDIKSQLKFAPHWIQKYIKSLYNSKQHVD